VFPAISNEVNGVKCGLEVEEAESKQDSAGKK
jgi:hypothetical protein